jgi:hypothetical protein
MKRVLIFLAIAITSAAFASDIKLPSGRVLKIAQMGPIVYTTGIPSSLRLKYETTVDIASQKAVTAEVEEIWETFRLEAEKGKYSSAVISVVGPSSGLPPFATVAKQLNFVFQKNDGTWKMELPSIWEAKPSTSQEPSVKANKTP